MEKKKERKEDPLEIKITYFVRYKMVLHVFKRNHSKITHLKIYK